MLASSNKGDPGTSRGARGRDSLSSRCRNNRFRDMPRGFCDRRSRGSAPRRSRGSAPRRSRGIAPRRSRGSAPRSELRACSRGLLNSKPDSVRETDEVYLSFRRGLYSPSTGLEEEEWKIMYSEFIASGLLVKGEPDSD